MPCRVPLCGVLLATLLVAAGCAGDAAAPAPLCESACRLVMGARTFAERCVRVVHCRDAGDCPSGLVCAPRPLAAPDITNPSGIAPRQAECGAGEPDTGNACQVPAPDPPAGRDLRALIDGFGVEAFELVQAAAEAARPTFSFEAPAGTRYVVCALFACLPDVRSDTPDGPKRIRNDAQCLVARRLYARTSGVADPADFEPPERTATICARGLVRQVTALHVGCWAYGDTALMGASELVTLAPQNLDTCEPLVAPVSESGSKCEGFDGMACALSASGDTFGTCHAGICRLRCTRDADCQPVTAAGPDGDPLTPGAAGRAAIDAETPLVCDFPTGDYPGVCVAAP